MQALAGFANAGVIGWAAYQGTNSFRQWLLQRQTERKIAAGERVLTVVYRARDAISHMRAIFHNGYEISAAEEKLSKSYSGFEHLERAKKLRLTTAQVILDRANASADIWKELFECMPLARAFFGTEMDQQLRQINQARHRILTSAEALVDLDGEKHEDFADECEDDIWGGKAKALGRPDRVQEMIDTAVGIAEQSILPVIAPPLPK